MPDLPAIDAHVHTYRSREIGRQAMQGSGQTDYGGTVEELLAVMQRGGVERAVMVNMTPVVEMADAAITRLPPDLTADQRAQKERDVHAQMIGRLQRRNEWTCEMARRHPELAAFIGLDPLMGAEEMVAEIDRQAADGIKLHPPNQRFPADDHRLWPAYERAQELGLPIIFHSGAQSLAGPSDYSHPERFRDVLSAFPRLTVVMAHLAFGDFTACAGLAREFDNVFFDCCFVINGTDDPPRLSDDEAAAAIRHVGVERVMFGSDYPWYDPALDAGRIRRLPLSEDEKRSVLRDNAVRILGL